MYLNVANKIVLTHCQVLIVNQQYISVFPLTIAEISVNGKTYIGLAVNASIMVIVTDIRAKTVT